MHVRTRLIPLHPLLPPHQPIFQRNIQAPLPTRNSTRNRCPRTNRQHLSLVRFPPDLVILDVELQSDVRPIAAGRRGVADARVVGDSVPVAEKVVVGRAGAEDEGFPARGEFDAAVGGVEGWWTRV